jgi:hypothetical protein
MSAKKKQSPKPSASKAAITKTQLEAAVQRLKSGATVIDEARRLGFHDRIALRTALTDHLGGKAQYRALLKAAPEKKAKTQKKGNGKKSAAPPEKVKVAA